MAGEAWRSDIPKETESAPNYRWAWHKDFEDQESKLRNQRYAAEAADKIAGYFLVFVMSVLAIAFGVALGIYAAK